MPPGNTAHLPRVFFFADVRRFPPPSADFARQHAAACPIFPAVLLKIKTPRPARGLSANSVVFTT